MCDNDIIYDNEIMAVVLKQHNITMELLHSFLQDYYGYSLIPLNSLTREVSGLIIFVKNKKYSNNYSLSQFYYVVTTQYIKTDFISEIDARCKTKIIIRKRNYSILDIETNATDEEIRLKLAEYKYPIIGDYKYQSILNPLGRICLHLYRIRLTILGKIYDFSTPIPYDFKIFSI